jgi:hypothetical protein
MKNIKAHNWGLTTGYRGHEHARNLFPRWKGFVALRYGPNADYKIPRQAPLAWHIESRAFWKAFRRPWCNVKRPS